MKDVKNLIDQDANKVSGGSWGYNKYERFVYHDAGFITSWSCELLTLDTFYFRINENTKSYGMNEGEANKYADYFLSHTYNEYLKYVQKTFPNCQTILKGYDGTVPIKDVTYS